MVKAIAHAKGGHLGGPLSATDILTALYFRVLNIRPDEPGWPDRDRFILSKGHSCIALYVVMALRGYFPLAEVSTFDAIDSRLQGHPDMTALPGLDMSSGSLGLGFAAGVGVALGAKLRPPRLHDLRHGRRRRMQRGRHLGRRARRAALRAGQPGRHR